MACFSLEASHSEGLDCLETAVREALGHRALEAEVEIGVANGRVLAYLAQHAQIHDRTYDDDRVRLQCRLPRRCLEFLSEYGVDVRANGQRPGRLKREAPVEDGFSTGWIQLRSPRRRTRCHDRDLGGSVEWIGHGLHEVGIVHQDTLAAHEEIVVVSDVEIVDRLLIATFHHRTSTNPPGIRSRSPVFRSRAIVHPLPAFQKRWIPVALMMSPSTSIRNVDGDSPFDARP